MHVQSAPPEDWLRGQGPRSQVTSLLAWPGGILELENRGVVSDHRQTRWPGTTAKEGKEKDKIIGGLWMQESALLSRRTTKLTDFNKALAEL